MLILEFSEHFLYLWNCTKLSDKHFFIICRTSSFGQPGKLNAKLTKRERASGIGFQIFVDGLSVKLRTQKKNLLPGLIDI